MLSRQSLLKTELSVSTVSDGENAVQMCFAANDGGIALQMCAECKLG